MIESKTQIDINVITYLLISLYTKDTPSTFDDAAPRLGASVPSAAAASLVGELVRLLLRNPHDTLTKSLCLGYSLN